MKRTKGMRMTRGDACVALCILVLAVVLAAALFPRGEQGLTVHAVRDGELIFVRSLEKVSMVEEVAIRGDYSLTLELSENGVRVKESACPGQDCCHMGIITKEGQQIVCLPNRLVITLHGQSSSYDAVTG